VVTASDCAAILGEDPRRGSLAVYASKVGEFEVEETLPMRRGRRLEATIAEEYQDQTGRPVASVPEYELLFHPDLEWLAATLDRKTLATEAEPDPFGRVDVGPNAVSRAPAPLQIKYALGTPSHWKDEPPLAYAVQVAIETACAGAEWGALCGMVDAGPLRVFDLPRNDAFFDAALPRLEEFHWRVRNRKPPEADGLHGTTEALKRLYSDEDGATIPLNEALDLVVAWEQAKARQKAANATADELENKLRARMGSASFGSLSDGSFLTLRLTKVRGYTKTVAPTSYRALRRYFPRIRNRMSPEERF
ncbi:hypothetical protein LCGC14_1985750, partial [marine sediment metagenome]